MLTETIRRMKGLNATVVLCQMITYTIVAPRYETKSCTMFRKCDVTVLLYENDAKHRIVLFEAVKYYT